MKINFPNSAILFLLISYCQNSFSQNISEEWATDYYELAEKDSESENELNFDIARIFYEGQYETKIDLFGSGKVYAPNELTEYIQNLTNHLLKSDDELRSKIKCYVLNYNIPNAFSLWDGSVFINIGMISEMSTESHLAFVLAHEFAHIKFKHLKKQYIRYQNITEQEEGKTENGNLELFKKYNYSQLNELDADAWALNVLAKAGYRIDDPETLFDFKREIHTPSESKKYLHNVLSTKNFVIDTNSFRPITKFNLDKRTINIIREYRSIKIYTHPSSQTRIKAFNQIVEHRNLNKKGNDFVLSDSRTFRSLINYCKSEYIDNEIQETNYFSALEESVILYNEYSKELDLDLKILQCLYYIMYYKEIECLANIAYFHDVEYITSLSNLAKFFNSLTIDESRDLAYSFANEHFNDNINNEDYSFYRILISLRWLGFEASEQLIVDHRNRFDGGNFNEYLSELE